MRDPRPLVLLVLVVVSLATAVFALPRAEINTWGYVGVGALIMCFSVVGDSVRSYVKGWKEAG